MKTNQTKSQKPRSKPDFIRQQSSYKKFNQEKWRYPRGKHSKIRLGMSGHRPAPSIGYGNPKDIRGLNKYGLEEVLVSNASQLENLNPDIHAVILSGKLGILKRIRLLEKIKLSKLRVMNVKDIDAYIKNVQDAIKKKKEEKAAKATRKKVTKKEIDKKEVKKKEEGQTEKEISQEDKDKEKREMQRKVLERKD